MARDCSSDNNKPFSLTLIGDAFGLTKDAPRIGDQQHTVAAAFLNEALTKFGIEPRTQTRDACVPISMSQRVELATLEAYN